MADSGTYDDATQTRRKMAAALLGKALQPEEKVTHWAQGLANLAKAGIGGYMGYQANEEAKAEKAQGQADLYSALGLTPPVAAKPPESPGMFSKIGALLSGGGDAPPSGPAGLPSDQAAYPAPPPAAPAPPTFRPGIVAPEAAASVTLGAPDYSKAIAGIESGGAYDKLGPTTKNGDRAFGKYQVMGNNIPEWTEAALGKRMTPAEFLANPDAQEAVFKQRFGSYVDKYGPEGAAKAWFAGEKGMNNPNAKDVLGTSVQGYGQKFMTALGPQGNAPQIAKALSPSAGDAALPLGAAPVQGALPTAEQAGRGVLAGVPQETKLQIAQLLNSKNPTAQAMGTALLQQAIKPRDVSYQTTPDGTILKMDPTGKSAPVPVYQAATKPTFGETGEVDPQTGQPVRGFIDTNKRTVEPYRPQGAAAAQPSTLPPVPAGVDPKVWRETFSKNAAQGATPASFDDTSKLRNEISQLPSYKNMAQAAPIYKSMADAAGRNTKAADLNMVYGLGKIMDPGSVVREGEIQMANNAQGWQEKLNGIIGQINNEGGLTPAGRQALMAEAHSRIQSYKMMYDQDAERYRGIATRNRANPEDVVHNFGEFEPWMAPKPPAPAPAAQIDDLVKKYAK